MPSKPKQPDNTLAKNKKAYHDYEVLETFEAGIRLSGPEVKSLREHKANLKGSFASIWKGEMFADNVHISAYRFAPDPSYNPTKRRKLLLHQKEILKIGTKINEKGTTIIPLEIYLKGSLIKVKLGLCRGRKLYDKREMLKKRDQDMEVKRAIKR